MTLKPTFGAGAFTPEVAAFAPGSSTTHISEVTVEAIDKIGDATATQLETTANAIEAAASELAGKIMGEAKERADELRKAAHGHRIPSAEDDGEPSPAFLHTTDAGGRPNGRGAG